MRPAGEQNRCTAFLGAVRGLFWVVESPYLRKSGFALLRFWWKLPFEQGPQRVGHLEATCGASDLDAPV